MPANSGLMDDYRSRLRQSLDASRGRSAASPLGYTTPPIGEPAGEGPLEMSQGDALDARGVDPSFRSTGGLPGDVGQPVEGGAIDGPPMADAGHGPIKSPLATGSGMPLDKSVAKAQVGPPKDLKYDKEKLKNAKTMADHVMAMKPASSKRFMDWWEEQHGSINATYDKIKEDLGHRPQPDRVLSKKEKFSALMDFGINLVRASKTGDANPGATAAVETLGGMRDKAKLAGDEYDAKSSLIEKQRGEALKTIGTRGEAMKSQAAMDASDSTIDKNARPDRKTQATDQGLIQSVNGGEFQPVMVDGKRATNERVGSRGASASSRDTRTAPQKNIDDLIERGIPKQVAIDWVYKRLTDPKKTYEAIYRDRRRNYASEDEAKKEAEQLTAELHGDSWRTTPTTTKNAMPATTAKVTNKAQYDALPPGSTYTAPDGSIRTKKR